MEDELPNKCPAEVYGADIAAVVLRRIYENQEECARIRGCARERCAIEKHWPRTGKPAAPGMDPQLVGFIKHGFNGPGEPAKKDSSAAPGANDPGGNNGPYYWDFLGND
jgi:hypothetical protein